MVSNHLSIDEWQDCECKHSAGIEQKRIRIQMNVELTYDIVDRIYTKLGSPGYALAVMRDGNIIYKQGFGLADLENDIPFLPSTVFNIGLTAK
jgi:CubicO group peptidase (beta-lactamase class C family)